MLGRPEPSARCPVDAASEGPALGEGAGRSEELGAERVEKRIHRGAPSPGGALGRSGDVAGVGWRIWNRKQRRWWGNFFAAYPTELLAELNGQKRPKRIAELSRASYAGNP